MGRYPYVLSIAGCFVTSATFAQTNSNPPKLQKQLEQAAAATGADDEGIVRQTGASVGYRALIVHFAPSNGADSNAALAALRAVNWEQRLCINPNIIGFMNKENVKVVVSYDPTPDKPVVVHEITAQSCTLAARSDASVSRLIGGIAFGPKPTQSDALAKVRAYIVATFKDPGSAQINCGSVSEPAWIKPILERRRYGYFIECDINGKNSYGGYVGFSTYVFRMNGDEFESTDTNQDDIVLMDPQK